MKEYFLAIDQGTTGSTALICERKGLKIIAKENVEFTQHFPRPGEVEHDLNEIFDSITQATKAALKAANIKGEEICAIGITNQRETTCAYNRRAEPLTPAIVWQDRRTSSFCRNNENRYNTFKELTGLPLDPYFSGSKMRWMLEEVEAVKKAAAKDDLLLSTIDSYLLYRLSDKLAFKTEPSNASRTLLMNLNSRKWDDRLLNFFKVPKSALPSIEDSFGEFAKTKGLDFLPDGIPITCILGDQQAALFGQGGVRKDDLKCTYGTGAFVVLNTGEDVIHSKHGLLTTIAYQYKGKALYAMEGSTYIAGAAVQWLRDNLQIIDDSAQVETLALKSKIEQTQELFFFPFFTGLGAPYWNSDVRASISGITRGTSKEDIARVCLEGVAQSVADSVEAMEKDIDRKLEELRVDGGASANDLLMQIQANFCKSKVIRPKVIETTAFGVVLGSALVMEDITLDEMKQSVDSDKSFTPKSDSYYESKRATWTKTLRAWS